MFKFRSVGRQTDLNLAGVYFIPEYFPITRPGEVVPDDILALPITEMTVELYLPQGLEAWREVAVAYQSESMEATLRWGGDLRDNRMQKPKGKPGVLSDRRSYLPMH